MRVKQQLITPKMARKWLDENNVRNRNLSKKRVNTYAQDMLEGAWDE